MNKNADNPRRALGKGLTALLPTRPTAHVRSSKPRQLEKRSPNSLLTSSRPIRCNRGASSIRSASRNSLNRSGPMESFSRWLFGATRSNYQLVAGERRWRAAKLAGVTHVPAVVQEIPDDRLLEITLIENIQREDLNPIETAQAFDRLCRELNLDHDEVGHRTGKDRSTIANLIRLLALPPDLQQLIAERRLSAGHARACLRFQARTFNGRSRRRL